MKNLLIFLLAIVFSLSTISVVNADRNKKQKRGGDRYQEKRYDDRHYSRNPQYRGHKKWSHHNRRHYKRSHPYYKGHWKSKRAWERHHRQDRHRYKDQEYYRDNRGKLRFKFCDEQACFSISISN